MLDYKHIFYSSIPAVGNPSAFVGVPLGATNGPGFGWHDVNAVAIAAEWRLNPQWTLRAGYEYNGDPVQPQDVTLNILAPGVVTNHFSGGFTWNINARSSVDFAATFAPTHSVSGPEIIPGMGATGRTITLSMHQYYFTAGYRYHF